jgi:transcriptional regulator with XRE-family HTH domain
MFRSVEILPAMARGGSHPESKEALAERLFLLRNALGYTQAFAAKLIGVKREMWTFWETPTNTREPSSRQLVDIEIRTGAPREWVQSGIAVRMPPILAQKLADALDRLEGGQNPRRHKS